VPELARRKGERIGEKNPTNLLCPPNLFGDRRNCSIVGYLPETSSHGHGRRANRQAPSAACDYQFLSLRGVTVSTLGPFHTLGEMERTLYLFIGTLGSSRVGAVAKTHRNVKRMSGLKAGQPWFPKTKLGQTGFQLLPSAV